MLKYLLYRLFTTGSGFVIKCHSFIGILKYISIGDGPNTSISIGFCIGIRSQICLGKYDIGPSLISIPSCIHYCIKQQPCDNCIMLHQLHSRFLDGACKSRVPLHLQVSSDTQPCIQVNINKSMKTHY